MLLRNTLGAEVTLMKSTRFTLGKALWRTLTVLCAVLFVTFGFTGCQPDPETEYVYIYVGGDESKPDASLIGDWTSPYSEVYSIKANTFANLYTDEETYTGKNLYVLKVSETEGYIYFEYTKAYEFTTEDKSADSSWTYTTWPSTGYYRYSTTAEDVGKWYAVHYQALTNSSIEIAGASGTLTSTETLAQAIQEFTVANGYFGDHSECTR